MQGEMRNVGLPQGDEMQIEMHEGCEIRERAGQPGTWTVYCKMQGYPGFRYVA